MPGGLRGGAGRTPLLLLTLGILFLVTGVASATLFSVYGDPGQTSAAFLLVVTGPLSILAVLVVVLALSRPEGVEEVFLVHDSGLLLVHFSKTVRPEKDRDIVIGMLTAVQGFIRDAFSSGSPRDLRMLDFGDRKIVICKGTYSYLALLVRGRVPLGLEKRMRRTIEHVEQTYQRAIEKWNGSAEGLAGADEILIEGLLGDELRQFLTQVRVFLATVVRILRIQRVRAGPKVPAGRTTRVDPRDSAKRLMERPEIQTFKPEYREMMLTSLHELREGRFTLAGMGNVYMTMAMQKSPRSATTGWWELLLRTVREALRTWPWEPDTQSWVMPNVPAYPEPGKASAAETPAPSLPPEPLPLAAGGPANAPAAAAERGSDAA